MIIFNFFLFSSLARVKITRYAEIKLTELIVGIFSGITGSISLTALKDVVLNS